MPSWKKVITSGSSAELKDLATTNITASGNISSSLTGSFGSGYIDNNLGIGTTSPGKQLHVVGQAYITQEVYSDKYSGYQYGGQLEFNTGDVTLQSNTDDPIIFNTDGANTRMYISGSGNVGIGTASPGNLLEVGTDSLSAHTYIEVNSNTNYDAGIKWSNAGTTKWIGYTGQASYPNDLLWSDTADTRVIFKEGGNVGIGVTDPDTTLEILDTTTQLKLSYDGSNATTFTVDSSGGYSIDCPHNMNIDSDRNMDFDIGSVGDGREYRFKFANSELLTFQGDLNGIGTTSPNALLHLSDATDNEGHLANLRIDGDWNETDGAYGTGRAGGSIVLKNLDSTNGNYSTIAFENANGYGGAGIHGVNVTHGAGSGNMDTALAFYTRGIHGTSTGYRENMRLNEDGKLGIGTSSPGEMLTVTGNISASGAYFGNRTFTTSTTTDGDGNGDVVYFGTGTSVVGKIYHYKSDSSWELADANDIAKCDGLLAVALGDDPDVDGMLLRGMVTLVDIQGSEAVGDVLYLSEAATGQADCVAPSGTGDVVRVIGYCLTTDDQIWFNPDNTWVEVA